MAVAKGAPSCFILIGSVNMAKVLNCLQVWRKRQTKKG